MNKIRNHKSKIRNRTQAPLYSLILLFSYSLILCNPARAVDLASDVADPMFIEKFGDFTSRTSADIGKYFQMREIASYGFSDRFSLAADVNYRIGTENDTDGFSHLGFLGTYRAGQGKTGATDFLMGFSFGNQGVVPSYDDEVYSAGARTGKQWTDITLSATIMTNWIFKTDGMAYIDLMPEAYVRLPENWSLGVGAVLRKATKSTYDQEWLSVKVGKTIGLTGWFLNAGYEFESEDIRIGGNVNMLF